MSRLYPVETCTTSRKVKDVHAHPESSRVAILGRKPFRLSCIHSNHWFPSVSSSESDTCSWMNGKFKGNLRESNVGTERIGMYIKIAYGDIIYEES